MPQSQYDPGFSAFGGGASSSVLHPAVLAFVIVIAVLTFLLPRKYVVVPLLLGILLTPTGQNLNIGVHLYVYRLLVLVGCVRLLSERKSLLAGGFSTLDKIFLVWAIYRWLAEVLQFQQVGAAMYHASLLLDALCGYFLFRSLIRDSEDVARVVKVFAIVAFVAAIVMVIELGSGRNVLGFLGGIRLTPDVRNGRIRAQGVFAHSIIAGSVGATIFPLCLWLWNRGKARVLAAIGAVSSSIMVFACASSTPVAAWLGSILVVCLWPIRSRMRLVRWGIVFSLVLLQLIMKAPIWYLMARIDFAGGSSGWNRAFLIDTFTRHLSDWWLIGTHDNVNWGWDMWDQCNQFVSEGEAGGLVAFVCFIAMFVICFKIIGKSRRAVAGHRRREWQVWLLGATMFAQIMAYMGVDYFDQSKFVWYMLLAMIPAGTVIKRASTSRDSARRFLDEPVAEISAPESVSVASIRYSSITTTARHLFG